MSEKDLAYYMNLPYKVEIANGDGDGFHVEIPELDGCMAYGDTVDDAKATLEDIKEVWFELALERGWPIPEPTREEADDE